MGAESSVLADYQLQETFLIDSNLDVTVAPAISNSDGGKYTFFKYENNSKHKESVAKHIEGLKTLRHPYILKFVASFDMRHHRCVVTEHVTPIDVAIERQQVEEIFTGLYNILETLIFLHKRASICHNNICVSSVFVTDNGVWKLGAFEHSTKVKNISKQSFTNDIKGYGEFALSVLDYLKDERDVTASFMKLLEEECCQESVLTDLNHLWAHPFFNVPFIEIIRALTNITSWSRSETLNLFNSLAEKLRTISPEAVGRHLIPLLFSYLVITDAAAEDSGFLRHLFSACDSKESSDETSPIFGKEYFLKYSFPMILTLFKSRDTTVRYKLLKYFPLYCHCMEQDVLQHVVLPELLLGLKDVNDEIVTATFRALADLVPVLGGQAVVGGERENYFCSWKPDFSRSGPNVSELKDNLTVNDVMFKSSVGSSSIDKKQRQAVRTRMREEHQLRREERKMKKEKLKESEKQDIKKEINKLGEEKCEDEHSEPEWEGFEAISCESDNKDDDDLSMLPVQQPLSFTTRQSNHYTNQPPDDRPLNTSKSSGGLKLLSGKKMKPPIKNANSKMKLNKLGSEFDIKVKKQTVEEPDYFADMFPVIKDKQLETVVIKTSYRNELSSKFDVLHEGNDDDWNLEGWGEE